MTGAVDVKALRVGFANLPVFTFACFPTFFGVYMFYFPMARAVGLCRAEWPISLVIHIYYFSSTQGEVIRAELFCRALTTLHVIMYVLGLYTLFSIPSCMSSNTVAPRYARFFCACP